MSWRGWLILLLLAGSLAIGVAINRQNKAHTENGSSSQSTDYVLHDFTLTMLKEDGSEIMTLVAPRLARTLETRELNINTPLITFPDKDGQQWRSRSKTAWINADGSEAHLRGDVVLDSPGHPRSPLLETQALNIYPDTDRVTSTEPVVITQPGSIIRGRGLEAQLDTQRVTLQSEVHVRYVPSAR